MGQDELRRALHEASAGPERDFTGTWGAGRKMRRRRQGAQALGGAALAAVAIGAFAFGGGGLLGEDATINPAPPDPDEVTVTESATTAPTTDVPTTDATDTATTDEPTTGSQTTEEAAAEATTGDPGSTAPPAPTGADPSPTGTAPTGPTTDPADPTGPTEPTGDLIVLPNPCDQPTTGLTVNAGGTDGAILDRAEQLLELASTCDLDGLIELAHDQNTTLSFGATTPEQAFSGEEGRTRVHALATLLVNYPPEIGGGSDGPVDSAMWPLITPEQWPELVELGIATPEDVASFEELGDYLGWRIYIEGGELAGNWSGMIAGD